MTSKSNFVRNRNEVVQDLLLFENIVMLHPWGREVGNVSILEHVWQLNPATVIDKRLKRQFLN